MDEYAQVIADFKHISEDDSNNVAPRIKLLIKNMIENKESGWAKQPQANTKIKTKKEVELNVKKKHEEAEKQKQEADERDNKGRGRGGRDYRDRDDNRHGNKGGRDRRDNQGGRDNRRGDKVTYQRRDNGPVLNSNAPKKQGSTFKAEAKKRVMSLKDITSQIYNLFKNKGVVVRSEEEEEEKKGEDQAEEVTYDNLGSWINSCYYPNEEEEETRLSLSVVIREFINKLAEEKN